MQVRLLRTNQKILHNHGGRLMAWSSVCAACVRTNQKIRHSHQGTLIVCSRAHAACDRCRLSVGARRQLWPACITPLVSHSFQILHRCRQVGSIAGIVPERAIYIVGAAWCVLPPPSPLLRIARSRPIPMQLEGISDADSYPNSYGNSRHRSGANSTDSAVSGLTVRTLSEGG